MFNTKSNDLTSALVGAQASTPFNNIGIQYIFSTYKLNNNFLGSESSYFTENTNL